MDLRSRLAAILAGLGVDDNAAGALFDELAERYGEPVRHYHVLGHVEEVLGWLDVLGEDLEDRTAVELAAWFHDAVYDPTASDNEDRSARLAVDRLGALGVPDALSGEVARLVRLTRTHRADPADLDGAVLLDADLAVLGSAPDDYDRYRAAIRLEYGFVAETEFRLGRAAVLRSLAEGSCYRTPTGRDRLEARARANIARELADLGGA